MTPNPPTTQIVANCPACGAKADVTAHEPFTKVTCPSCEEPFRARNRFNHFLLEEQCGTGGMSRVFKALDTSLERAVALKILNRACSQDGARVRQFEKEAEITAQVSHPNVVRVFTAGRDQGYFYIAMELVNGGSLEALLRDGRKQPEAKVLEMAVQAVQGLRAAHKAGLIHRDIKPGNILFAEDGTPKIVDFGLAIFAREADGTGEIWATPYYVPPETLHHEPEDFRSDIYSLGATLYHALVGRPACDKDQAPLAELREIKAKPVYVKPSATKLSEETCAVLERAMAVKREARYRSYDEFLDHLKYAQRRLRRGGKGKPWPGRQRRGLAPWQWVAGAAAVIAAGTFFVMKKEEKPKAVVSSGMLTADADPTARSDTSTSERYNKGRDALHEGDFNRARGFFEGVGDNPSTRQPTRNWARFNAGLCALFMGDADGARRNYETMAGDGLYSSAATDVDLAGFFRNASRWLSAEEAVPREKAEDCPANSATAIGLLAAGLKNWNAGEAAAALPFLQAFQDSAPPEWVSKCKPLIRDHLNDAGIVVSLPLRDVDRMSPAEGEATVASARGLVAKLKLSGPVKERAAKAVDALAAAVEKKKEAIVAVKEGDRTERANAELKAILDASAVAATPGREYRFLEVEGKIRTLPATQPEVPSLRDAHADSWLKAHRFLEQLARDLEARPMEGVIEQNGQSVRALITAKGTVLNAKLLQSAGVPIVPIPMGKAPSNLLLELAMDIRLRITDSEDFYRRSEMIYCFALRTGQKGVANDVAEMLSAEQVAFRRTVSDLSVTKIVAGVP